MNDSNQECPADKSPSPPFRGEREGPNPQGWEGEVGGLADQHLGPPHPALSPRPAGGEGKESVIGVCKCKNGFKLNQPSTVAEFFGLL
jgi:hypothetical protein